MVKRLTISLDDDIADAIDAFIRDRGYSNRSEAIRDLARAALAGEAASARASASCVAVLSYVYDPHERELHRRLVQAHHEHHDVALATTHVHLDHESCVEVSLLKGPTAEVRALATRLIAERGVHHGSVNVIPVTETRAPHRHGPGGRRHRHLRPAY